MEMRAVLLALSLAAVPLVGFAESGVGGKVGVTNTSALPAPATVSATDVAQGRYGNILFELPRDWSRRPSEHYTTFGPEGKGYELRVLEGAEEPGSAKDFLARAINNLKGQEVLSSTPLQTYEHPDGWTLAWQSVVLKNVNGVQHWAFFTAKAGKRLQPFMYVAGNEELFKQNLPTVERIVKSLRFANLIVLHPGNAAKGIPALTQFTVNETADFLEWFMGVPFTQQQRETFQGILLDNWKKQDKGTADDIASILKLAADFRALPAEKRDLARQGALIQSYLPSWREQLATDPACKLLVEVYDAAHKPIAKGDPPLTRQAADAFLETVYFVAAELENVPQVSPTAEEKEQFAGKLAQVYGEIGPEERKTVANMPLVWSALRLSWPEMSAAQKSELLQQFGGLAPVKTLRAQVATARQAADRQVAAGRATDTPAVPPATPARADNTATPSLKDPVAAMPADRQAAYLAAMQKMQRDQQNYQMFSQMSRQMHETRMNVIRNIGGSGTQYRWEYRPARR